MFIKVMLIKKSAFVESLIKHFRIEDLNKQNFSMLIAGITLGIVDSLK